MANFWFKFEWDAWRDDKQLRRCSKETRGFWIDCITEMEKQETYFLEGTPEELCRDVTADRGEFDRSIAELTRTGAATVDKCQGVVKIVSRRLLKKVNITEYNRLKQQESRERLRILEMSSQPSKDQSLRALDSPIGEVFAPATKPDQKTLLPENYRPPDDFWNWGLLACPDLDLSEELDEFKTFWRDIATKNHKRTIRGWNATWKGRMKDQQKEAAKKSFRPNGNGKPKPDMHVGKSDPERTIEPIEPCRFCGDDICFQNHREELLQEQSA